jgi:hypothetical protein
VRYIIYRVLLLKFAFLTSAIDHHTPQEIVSTSLRFDSTRLIMVHLVLTGATGAVGGSVLAHILSLPPTTNISRLSILSRSNVPMLSQERKNTTTQIDVITTTDYLNYPPEVLAQLKDVSGVIWAQGISQTEVDKPTYVKITKDYPLAFAKAMSSSVSKPLTFIYVSGEGATDKTGLFTPFFAAVKREAEKTLLSMPKEAEHSNLRPYNVRPGGVDATVQPELWNLIKHRRSGVMKAMNEYLLPVMRAAMKNMVIGTPTLGKVLTELALKEGEPLDGRGAMDEGRTFNNIWLRRTGGLPT